MPKSTETFITKPSVVYLLALLCCVLWGSAFPSIKIGYALLAIAPNDTASQIVFAGLRFGLAGVLTILIFSIKSKRFLVPHKTALQDIGKLSLVQTIMQYMFLYIGLSNASAAKSAIIVGASPFIAIIIASLIFKQEKLTKTKLFGSLLGFAGIIIINLDFVNLKADMTLTGEGFVLLSATATALSATMIKRYSRKEDPVVLSGYQFILGGIIMTAVGFMMGGTLNFQNINAVLILTYLAFLSAIAYSLWSILLKYNPVSKVLIFGFTIPIFGVILSAALLNEGKQALTMQSLLSLLLVCLGIIFINKYAAKNETT